jgi:hypothetical protein
MIVGEDYEPDLSERIGSVTGSRVIAFSNRRSRCDERRKKSRQQGAPYRQAASFPAITHSRVAGRMERWVEVRLSELFVPGKDSLVIYHMMFPRSPVDRRLVARLSIRSKVRHCTSSRAPTWS